MINKIKIYIKNAKEKYHKCLFGRFWDSVEEITISFGEYHTLVRQLSELHDKYESGLKSIMHAEHNFPKTILNMKRIPNVYREIDEFQEIVEWGESNYNFADICESRRTREVLIAGFTNLQASVEGIGKAIINELKALGNRQKDDSDLRKGHLEFPTKS